MGVEPDFVLRSWIKRTLGLKILEKISQYGSEREAFDLVVSFHVLEHVPDPVDFLTRLKKVLRPNGEFVIEVPNVDDVWLGVYRAPSRLKFYYQKAHRYYFSKRTLALALEKAGYEAIICGIQRYDLSNHIRGMLPGQPGRHGYYRGILAPSAQAAYADSLFCSGHSDTLWGVARKTPKSL